MQLFPHRSTQQEKLERRQFLYPSRESQQEVSLRPPLQKQVPDHPPLPAQRNNPHSPTSKQINRHTTFSLCWSPLDKTLSVETIKTVIMFLNFPHPVFPNEGENPIPNNPGSLSQHRSSYEHSAFSLDTTSINDCRPAAYTFSTFTSFKPSPHSESPSKE